MMQYKYTAGIHAYDNYQIEKLAIANGALQHINLPFIHNLSWVELVETNQLADGNYRGVPYDPHF